MSGATEQYAVRNVGAVFGQALLGFALSGAMAWFAYSVVGSTSVAAVMMALAVIAVARRVVQNVTHVIAGPAGVSMVPRRANRSLSRSQRVCSPWHTVSKVELYPAADTVRVCLRSDVPLPPWVRGRVLDPNEPETGGYWEGSVHDLDAAAFTRAAYANAPHVEVRTLMSAP